MAETGDHAAVFEAERPHLLAVAYRMLGTWGDAEDAVQDAFLRFRDADLAAIASPRGLLTTIVVRLCLDALKSARARRERYDGLWLPEPVRTDATTIDRASVAIAFLVVLEALSPEERAVYVLHEIFDYPHAEIAAMLHKTEDACRQMLRRAHPRVAAHQPRYALSDDERQRLLARFLTACTTGDAEGLRAMLTADAAAWTDGGGKVAAARKPVTGADDVVRYLTGLAKKGAAGAAAELAEINGAPALILRRAGAIDSVAVLELAGEAPDLKIARIAIVRNPDKLTRL
ncbi:MAG TPA: RNA polymerase sigma factor SigJ [Kofleriaceae bacterium]|nr:RNA polymerase sigma factor SigJ [Kofleriaceae bacterium]